MKNYSGQGRTLDFSPASDTAGGAAMVMGDTVGVAVGEIAAGETGAVAVEGVYELPKVAGTAWTVGQALDFDASESAFTVGLTAASGDVTRCAVVAAPATSAATVGLVKLTNPGTAA